MPQNDSGLAAGVRRLQVRVTPNSRKEAILGCEEGILRVRVRAPAVEGRANKAVLALLAKVGECRRGELELLAGVTGRNKVVSVPEAACIRLMAAAKRASADAT